MLEIEAGDDEGETGKGCQVGLSYSSKNRRFCSAVGYAVLCSSKLGERI